MPWVCKFYIGIHVFFHNALELDLDCLISIVRFFEDFLFNPLIVKQNIAIFLYLLIARNVNLKQMIEI